MTNITRGKKVKVPPPLPNKPKRLHGVAGGLGSRIFSTLGTMKVVRSSPLRTGRLYPQEFSWYSFLEAESTPGHMEMPKLPEKIPNETTGDRSRYPSTCSAAYIRRGTGDKVTLIEKKWTGNQHRELSMCIRHLKNIYY
jgi:hypothetical protein